MAHLQSSNAYFELYPNKTCLVERDGVIIFQSEDKGVKPLRVYYQLNGRSEEPLTVIDRIMGKGAVMLAVHCGAVKIMTPIISQPALELAQAYGLEVVIDKVVPYIINRSGDGQCPIEQSVLDITDSEEGYKAIEKAIKILMAQN